MDEAVGGAAPVLGSARPRVGPVARTRLDRSLVVLAAAGFALWLAMWALILANPTYFGRFYGQDFGIYRDAAARWLAGDGFYHAYQLAGPYTLSFGDVLYPPPSLVLFVPFTVLPGALWWAIPIAVVAWTVTRLRPAPWALAAIVACLWWPDTSYLLIWGNPALWVVTAIALGTWRPFFSPLAMIKFTLAPAALLNVRRRSWWVGLGVLGAISLAFLPMWPDYVAAIRNLETPSPLTYSFREVPLVAIPWLAWLGRRRG